MQVSSRFLPLRLPSIWWGLFLVLWTLVGPVPANASAEPLAAPAALPALATALNPDGTLRAGADGSFNAAGYRLCQSPDGRPVFRPAGATGAGDQFWLNGFGVPGVGGIVNVLLADGSDVYVGGAIGIAGPLFVANVAKWNGAAWSALGAGVNMEVYALALNGTNLYAGGRNGATSTPSGAVARWDGTAWTTLGASLGTAVLALTVAANGDLFAGRYFNSGAGTVNRWNGSTWSPVGTGLFNAGVRALAMRGADLYVGGDFTQVNGQPVNYVAKWDGAAWSGLGAGLNNQVWALALRGTDLYVGGRFSTAGGALASNVARWDGTAWRPLGAGITSNNGTVSALAFDGPDVYVCGQFGAAGGSVANNVARWNGTTWSDVGAGPSYAFRALAFRGADLYLGGQFSAVGGVGATGIARRSAGTWQALGPGLNDLVSAVAVHGPDTYVGGRFLQAGGVAAHYVAKWNGSAWSPLGTGAAEGVNNSVDALVVASNGDVYVGGYFTQAGGVAANYVAKWNGTSWSPVGAGTNSPVFALATAGTGEVYAAGAFTQAGGVAANYVAKWNGSAWSALGTGVTGQTAPGRFVSVALLAVTGNGDVYIGGNNFTAAGGTPVNQVAKWNGSTWSDVGFLGTSAYVNALAASGPNLYVGGSLTSVGGVLVRNIARWDGTAWSDLGAGLGAGANVQSLAVRGADVYAGAGSPVFVVGGALTSVAHWDGTAWNALGTPLSHYVLTVAVGSTGAVAVGGMFGAIADRTKIMNYFGVYRPGVVSAVASAGPTPAMCLYPNPAQRMATLSLQAALVPRPLHVFDATGREVRRLVLPAQAASADIDLHGLPAGLYTVRCGQYAAPFMVE